MNRLVIAEHFYSIQGEGKLSGSPSIFLRLGGCNLNCGSNLNSTWICDTVQVWTKDKSCTIDDLITLFERQGYLNHLYKGVALVITGGEPLLQQKGLINFLTQLELKIINTFKLSSFNLFIEIETNGTILPEIELDKFVYIYNVSPKLKNSGELDSKRKLNLTEHHKGYDNYKTLCIYKFVINSVNDMKEIEKLIIENKLSEERIYLMPSGETKEEIEKILPLISEICKNKYYKLSTRLHLHIWNKKTGV